MTKLAKGTVSDKDEFSESNRAIPHARLKFKLAEYFHGKTIPTDEYALALFVVDALEQVAGPITSSEKQ